MNAAVGPEPTAAALHIPTIATAYPMGLPVFNNGITRNDHSRQQVHPTSMMRRRPSRSHSVADAAMNVMLAIAPNAPTNQMKLREYPRWECAYIARYVLAI